MSLVKFVTDRSLDRVDRNCFLKQNMFLVVLDINRGQRVLFSVKASDTSSQKFETLALSRRGPHPVVFLGVQLPGMERPWLGCLGVQGLEKGF